MSDRHPTRLVALVDVLEGERRAAQTAGYPLDPDKMLPVADVVLLVSDDGRGAMLFRYTAHGELAGDTLHASIAEARDGASDEYGDALGSWVEVPDDVDDPHRFAINYAAEQFNDRDENW